MSPVKTTCLICNKCRSEFMKNSLEYAYFCRKVFESEEFNIVLKASNICLKCIGRLQQLFDFDICKRRSLERGQEIGKICFFCNNDETSKLIQKRHAVSVHKAVTKTKWSQGYEINDATCYSCFNHLLYFDKLKSVLMELKVLFFSHIKHCKVVCSRNEINEALLKYSMNSCGSSEGQTEDQTRDSKAKSSQTIRKRKHQSALKYNEKLKRCKHSKSIEAIGEKRAPIKIRHSGSKKKLAIPLPKSVIVQQNQEEETSETVEGQTAKSSIDHRECDMLSKTFEIAPGTFENFTKKFSIKPFTISLPRLGAERIARIISNQIPKVMSTNDSELAIEPIAESIDFTHLVELAEKETGDIPTEDHVNKNNNDQSQAETSSLNSVIPVRTEEAIELYIESKDCVNEVEVFDPFLNPDGTEEVVEFHAEIEDCFNEIEVVSHQTDVWDPSTFNQHQVSSPSVHIASEDIDSNFIENDCDMTIFKDLDEVPSLLVPETLEHFKKECTLKPFTTSTPRLNADREARIINNRKPKVLKNVRSKKSEDCPIKITRPSKEKQSHHKKVKKSTYKNVDRIQTKSSTNVKSKVSKKHCKTPQNRHSLSERDFSEDYIDYRDKADADQIVSAKMCAHHQFVEIPFTQSPPRDDQTPSPLSERDFSEDYFDYSDNT